LNSLKGLQEQSHSSSSIIIISIGGRLTLVMTSRWSRRLTTVLMCVDIIVQLTVCKHHGGASSEQPVNYRG